MSQVRNKVDLHMHTTCSDGTLTPSEVVQLAKKEGLSTISITDHNTVSGIDEAKEIAEKLGITLIPGIEFTVKDNSYYLHILGYLPDYENKKLNGILKNYYVMKYRKTLKFLQKLRAHNINITETDIQTFGKVSYKNIARCLVHKGYVEDYDSAFERYIDNNDFFDNNVAFDLDEILELLKNIEGIAVFAHPFRIIGDYDELEKYITYLKSKGVEGIECYCKDCNEEQTDFLVKLANNLDMIIVGGSDFHGDYKQGKFQEIGIGDIDINIKLLEKLC